MAVLGGGLMGSGIATALCLCGVEVILKEVNQGFLDAGMGRVKANLASRVGAGGGKGVGRPTKSVDQQMRQKKQIYSCYQTASKEPSLQLPLLHVVRL